MTIEKMERVQYWAKETTVDVKSLTGEALEHDFNYYHDARARLHEKSEHDWGVAIGLAVSRTGDRELRVMPGVAIDRDGRLIALSDDDAGEDKRLGLISTTSQNTSKSYVVIRYHEELRGKKGDPVHEGTSWTEFLLMPKVTLESRKAVEDNPTFVVLAVVELDQTGKITALKPSLDGDPPKLGRKLVGQPAGEIRLRRTSVGSDGRYISDSDVVTIRPTSTGRGVAVLGDLEVEAGRELRIGTALTVDRKGSVVIGDPKLPTGVRPLEVNGSIFCDVLNTTASVLIGSDTKDQLTLSKTNIKTAKAVMSGAVNDYQKAQATLTGGGTVTWTVRRDNKPARLKWTERFIAVGMGGHNSTFSETWVEGLWPTSKEQVVSWDKTDRWSDDGIELKKDESLYGIHEVGSGRRLKYQIQVASTTFSTASNWLLIAVRNPDDSSLRLGTGATLSANSGLFEGSPIPRGTIMMWSGDAGKIPFGWAICDGQPGTPNLVGKFVMGAKQGSDPAPNAHADADTHTHDTPAMTLDTSTTGAHDHKTTTQEWYKNELWGREQYAYYTPLRRSICDAHEKDVENARTDLRGEHHHSVNIPSKPSSRSSGPNRPAWYALCYIIKL